MKLALLKAIVLNFAKLGTYDFWERTFSDPNYPGWLFAKMIIVQGLVDIFLMIFVPGYPEKFARGGD